jgi:hypothetical protein
MHPTGTWMDASLRLAKFGERYNFYRAMQTYGLQFCKRLLFQVIYFFVAMIQLRNSHKALQENKFLQ